MWIKVGRRTINLDNVSWVKDASDSTGDTVYIKFGAMNNVETLSLTLTGNEAQDFLAALALYAAPIQADGLAADMAKAEEPREVGSILPSPIDSDLPF